MLLGTLRTARGVAKSVGQPSTSSTSHPSPPSPPHPCLTLCRVKELRAGHLSRHVTPASPEFSNLPRTGRSASAPHTHTLSRLTVLDVRGIFLRGWTACLRWPWRRGRRLATSLTAEYSPTFDHVKPNTSRTRVPSLSRARTHTYRHAARAKAYRLSVSTLLNPCYLHLAHPTEPAHSQ